MSGIIAFRSGVDHQYQVDEVAGKQEIEVVGVAP